MTVVIDWMLNWSNGELRWCVVTLNGWWTGNVDMIDSSRCQRQAGYDSCDWFNVELIEYWYSDPCVNNENSECQYFVILELKKKHN